MKTKYSLTWDLDGLFPGGSQSPEFQRYLERLASLVKDISVRLEPQGQQQAADGAYLHSILTRIQEGLSALAQARSFVWCLISQDVDDEHANRLQGRVSELEAAFASLMNRLDQVLQTIHSDDWAHLLRDPRLQPLAFPLNERRERALEKLPLEQESLANDLSVDGYHAWGNLYSRIVGRMILPFEEGGERRTLSVGQATKKLFSTDRAIRQTVFHQLNEAWERESELLASCLNHLGGFRLHLYRRRGWDSVLKEPLDMNRMSEQTLNTMWEVVNRNKDMIIRFLERKASMLGLSRLSWYDLYAPISAETIFIPYDEAADFIIKNFKRFDPQMASFAHRAFTQRWIEAEDRAGKSPDGFCTEFPASGQSRIFMTYAGSATDLNILAHELGHAYHDHVMDDLPPMVQRYAMNVAETASTFAEWTVADAAIRTATSPEQQLQLLENKLQRAVAFFMNTHANFLFEAKFYEERRKGWVSVDRLKACMVAAQKQAYHDSLDAMLPTAGPPVSTIT